MRSLPRKKPSKCRVLSRKRKVQALNLARRTWRLRRPFLKDKLSKSYMSRLRSFRLNLFSNSIEVEESPPEGVFEEEIVFSIEDKVQIVPHLVPSHQRPTFINTCLDSSPHCDTLRKKRHFLSATAS